MKKRYLIGPRQGAVMPSGAEAAVASITSSEPGVDQVRKLPTGQHVVQMTGETAAKLAAEHPELLVEEDHEIKLFPMPDLPPAMPAGEDIRMRVEVANAQSGAPIGDVTIFAFGADVVYRSKTGADGVAVVAVREGTLRRVIASPSKGYWSKYVGETIVTPETSLKFTLQSLDVKGDYAWGPLAMSVDAVAEHFTGKGVKVAIIDSGVCPHEDVVSKGGLNTIDGGVPDEWNVDTEGHGTHCAGVTAALHNEIGIRGIAPDTEIYSVKVFPGGFFSDLVEAVNWCVDNYIDVISMSLGSEHPSQLLEAAINTAVDRGIVCVAAAGNDAGPVAYPAAFEDVIAVSAIGQLGAFPDDSAHALRASQYLSADGRFFAASFTNFGDKIEVCAPGVAIVSTVPGGYVAWDGTSMACPMITGLVALMLEAYPDLRTGTGWTTYSVRSLLAASAVDLGLPRQIQGAGLANAASALWSALEQRTSTQQNMENYKQYLESLLEQARHATKSIEDALGSIS